VSLVWVLGVLTSLNKLKNNIIRLIVYLSGTGSVLHTLKNPEEIFSVAWKPNGKWSGAVKLRTQVEPFVATSYTSFKPPCVKVCDREGKDIVILSQDEPKPILTDKKMTVRSVPSLWIHLPSDSEEQDRQLTMVSIDTEGKVVSWNQTKTPPEIVHSLHQNCQVFGLIQSGDVLWSISKEPYIIGWNLRSSKVEAIIPTYAGICSISGNSIEGTRFAVGGVDSYIRVLKVDPDYPNGKIPEMPLLPSRLQGKITAVSDFYFTVNYKPSPSNHLQKNLIFQYSSVSVVLFGFLLWDFDLTFYSTFQQVSWHPWLDKVGYGTDGGFIGVYDIKAESRYVMEFSKKIGGTVYTIDWGPKCYTPGMFCLLNCLIFFKAVIH